jgi:O-antigen/teichoic acid export membrane protein
MTKPKSLLGSKGRVGARAVVSGLYKPTPQLVLLATFGGTSVLNYAFGLAMGWILRPGDYGLLAFVQTLVLVGGLVMNSAFSISLARAVARADGPRERDALVRGTLLANLVPAVAMAAVIVVLFAAGPLRDGFERWFVVAVVALCFPFLSMVKTICGCAQGSNRFSIVAWIELTEMSCKTFSGGALALLGFGASGAIIGFLVGAVCAMTLGFRQLTHRIGVQLRGSLKLPDPRASAAIFAAMLGLAMLVNLDLIGLKLLSSERALVGYYQAGLMLSNAPFYLVLAVMTPVLFVQLARYEDASATQQKLGETLILTAALILPLEIILMAIPRLALITFFPDVYALGAPALRILALGNGLLLLALIFVIAFQAIGRAGIPALILLGVTLAEPFALWAVVPSWQMVGAAWVFAAVALLTLFCLVAAYLRESGAACLRRVAPWVIKYALAVGVGLAAGRLALGLGMVPAVGFGGVCYILVATLLGIVRPLAMLLRGGGSVRKFAAHVEE